MGGKKERKKEAHAQMVTNQNCGIELPNSNIREKRKNEALTSKC